MTIYRNFQKMMDDMIECVGKHEGELIRYSNPRSLLIGWNHQKTAQRFEIGVSSLKTTVPEKFRFAFQTKEGKQEFNEKLNSGFFNTPEQNEFFSRYRKLKSFE